MSDSASPDLELLSPVTLEELSRDSGVDSLEQDLRELRQWLQQSPSRLNSLSEKKHLPEFVARYASSLWARGECEFFGVSLPRFHGRVYLDEDNFVDVRRLKVLADNAGKWLEIDENTKKCDQSKSLASILQKGPVIAGGLFTPPAALSDFHHLTEERGHAMGEHLRSGSPFFKHMRLGGGMCSQACILMASLLLARHTRRIGGLAEMTLQARRNQRQHSATVVKIGDLDYPATLPISGLDAAGMIRSLPDGLTAWEEVALKRLGPQSKVAYPGEFGTLTTVVRSYVASGIPVIALVDLGRMAGIQTTYPGILATQGAHFPEHFANDIYAEPNRQRVHAVVVVGCHRQSPNVARPDDYQVLLHDPATYPFLKSTIRQLFDARTGPQSHLGFMPVLPNGVKLSLSGRIINDDGNRVQLFGLLDLVDARLTSHSTELWQKTYVKSEYRLVNFSDKSGVHSPYTLLNTLIDDKTLANVAAWGEMSALTWCWVQIGYHASETVCCVTLWDATQQTKPALRGLPIKSEYRPFWLKDFLPIDRHHDYSGGLPNIRSASVATPSRSARLADHLLPDEQKKCPWNIALISSFSMGSFEEISREYERLETRFQGNLGHGNRICVDLYCFMHRTLQDFFERRISQTELRHFWQRLTRTARSFENPTQFLSLLSDQGDDAQQLRCALVDDICSWFSPDHRKIVAMSSYFPQLTRPADSADASNALKCLGMLASELNSRGHSIRTIEVVAGTCVKGLFPCVIDGKTKYFAALADSGTGLATFFASLLKVASEVESVRRLRGDNQPPVSWCIEVEPGLLYHSSQLLKPSQMLPSANSVRLNCDSSHWFLDGVTDEQLERYIPSVGHCHYCGTWPHGHSSDVPTSLFDRSRDYARSLLDRLRTEASPLQTIALEIEAVRDRFSLDKAVEDMLNDLYMLP